MYVYDFLSAYFWKTTSEVAVVQWSEQVSLKERHVGLIPGSMKSHVKVHLSKETFRYLQCAILEYESDLQHWLKSAKWFIQISFADK